MSAASKEKRAKLSALANSNESLFSAKLFRGTGVQNPALKTRLVMGDFAAGSSSGCLALKPAGCQIGPRVHTIHE
jgi:hypothetical protein